MVSDSTLNLLINAILLALIVAVPGGALLALWRLRRLVARAGTLTILGLLVAGPVRRPLPCST